MTAYDAIRLLIEERVIATYEGAMLVIHMAYHRNKIDGLELEELAEMAEPLRGV